RRHHCNSVCSRLNDGRHTVHPDACNRDHRNGDASGYRGKCPKSFDGGWIRLAGCFEDRSKPDIVGSVVLRAKRLIERRGRCTDNLVAAKDARSEEHTSELQSRENLVCRLLLEKKK